VLFDLFQDECFDFSKVFNCIASGSQRYTILCFSNERKLLQCNEICLDFKVFFAGMCRSLLYGNFSMTSISFRFVYQISIQFVNCFENKDICLLHMYLNCVLIVVQFLFFLR
jgi:hypothetical protein